MDEDKEDILITDVFQLRIIHLQQGYNIVTFVRRDDQQDLIIYQPLSVGTKEIEPGQMAQSVMPFAPYSDYQKPCALNNDQILLISYPHPAVEEAHRKYFSNIILPDDNIII